MAFYRGCGDGKITGLCQRNLPVNWKYPIACRIEAPCSCLWLMLSQCLGRELHICFWAVGSACWRGLPGMHWCQPGVRECGKLKGVSSHLFNPFLVPEPASQSSQVAGRNCKVIPAFGAKILVWTQISPHLVK